MFHKHVCSKLSAHLLQHVVNGLRFSMFSLEVTRRREEKDSLHMEKDCGYEWEEGRLAKTGPGRGARLYDGLGQQSRIPPGGEA